MPEETYSDIKSIACTEDGDVMDCDIDMDDGDAEVEVSVVSTSDLHPWAVVKFSQDTYDVTRDQEYQIDFVGQGTCSVDTNWKGEKSLSCMGGADA